MEKRFICLINGNDFLLATLGGAPMHTIWKGAISFGLVHIPVKLYAATEEKEIALHLLHKSCHGTIKNQRYCPTCQSSVEPEDLIKGYPLDTNQYVTFEKMS